MAKLEPRIHGSPSWDMNSNAINAINVVVDCMASITIRQLPGATKRELGIRAAQNGRSMEKEAIRDIFMPLGGVELDIPPRRPIRDAGIK